MIKKISIKGSFIPITYDDKKNLASHYFIKNDEACWFDCEKFCSFIIHHNTFYDTGNYVAYAIYKNKIILIPSCNEIIMKAACE